MDVLPQQDPEIERELQEISSALHLEDQVERFFTVTNRIVYRYTDRFIGPKRNDNSGLWIFLCKHMSNLGLEIALEIRRQDVEQGKDRINVTFAEAAEKVLTERKIESILLED